MSVYLSRLTSFIDKKFSKDLDAEAIKIQASVLTFSLGMAESPSKQTQTCWYRQQRSSSSFTCLVGDASEYISLSRRARILGAIVGASSVQMISPKQRPPYLETSFRPNWQARWRKWSFRVRSTRKMDAHLTFLSTQNHVFLAAQVVWLLSNNATNMLLFSTEHWCAITPVRMKI